MDNRETVVIFQLEINNKIIINNLWIPKLVNRMVISSMILSI